MGMNTNYHIHFFSGGFKLDQSLQFHHAIAIGMLFIVLK